MSRQIGTQLIAEVQFRHEADISSTAACLVLRLPVVLQWTLLRGPGWRQGAPC